MTVRMRAPGLENALVELARLVRALDAHGILVIPVVRVGRAQMHDGRVARDLARGVRAELRPELCEIARPISEPVDRAAVAERDGARALAGDHAFELALHVEDGP